MRKSMTFFFCMIVLTLLLIPACRPFHKDVTFINTNDLAPPFKLNNLHGETVALEDLLNQKVYVKFWASWCSICLAGLEEIDELSTEQNDFKVITIVSPGYKGEQSSEKFTDWFQSLGTEQITVLLDEDGVWARKFGVVTYPTSYFISSYGTLEQTVFGHMSNKEIQEMMRKIK